MPRNAYLGGGLPCCWPATYSPVQRSHHVLSCSRADFIHEIADCKNVVVRPGIPMGAAGSGYGRQKETDHKSTRFISGKIQMKVSDFTFDAEGFFVGEFNS